MCLRLPVGALCRCFKTVAVSDIHFAPSGIDETASFQRLQPNGNSWASCSQHNRQKLMGERNVVTTDPIITRQKPSRQTFFKVRPCVAQGRIAGLDVEIVDIAQKEEA